MSAYSQKMQPRSPLRWRLRNRTLSSTLTSSLGIFILSRGIGRAKLHSCLRMWFCVGCENRPACAGVRRRIQQRQPETGERAPGGAFLACLFPPASLAVGAEGENPRAWPGKMRTSDRGRLDPVAAASETAENPRENLQSPPRAPARTQPRFPWRLGVGRGGRPGARAGFFRQPPQPTSSPRSC